MNKEGGLGEPPGDGDSRLEMELGREGWERKEGKRQADWADACGFPNASPLPLAFTACTRSMTDSLVKLSVLFSSNFFMLYFAA